MSELRVEIGTERMVFTDGVFPYMFQTRRGTLLTQAMLRFTARQPRPAKFSSGVPGFVISRDGARSWQRWHIPYELGDGPFFEGAATELEDGTILLLDSVGIGPTPQGTFLGTLWQSPDDFASLEGPYEAIIHLPQARGDGFDDGGRPSSGICFHRSMLQLPGGDLLATVYCWFQCDNTPCPYQPTMWKFRTALIRSSDRGRCWEYVTTVAVDPTVGEEGFNEPVMTRLTRGPKQGRLICLMRTGGHPCPLYQSISDNDGLTWRPPWPLAFCGVNPDLVEMHDGTLACSFGWRAFNKTTRTVFPEHGYYLAFSRDHGETWPHLVRVPHDTYSGIDRVNCYTSVREIARGKLLMLYDTGTGHHPVRYVASREIDVHL